MINNTNSNKVDIPDYLLASNQISSDVNIGRNEYVGVDYYNNTDLTNLMYLFDIRDISMTVMSIILVC